VNLAGPRAREILSELTELDCSPEAFKYLDGKQGKVAGVPCLILQIGFVGEVGYEIHFAAAYGEHVWDALMRAGGDKGIRLFGLEPQRILRLQKMDLREYTRGIQRFTFVAVRPTPAGIELGDAVEATMLAGVGARFGPDLLGPVAAGA
jgi:glycine cleavage system aminomethyltransferase T